MTTSTPTPIPLDLPAHLRLRLQILDALDAAGTPLATSDLCVRVAARPSRVRSALAALVATREVRAAQAVLRGRVYVLYRSQ